MRRIFPHVRTAALSSGALALVAIALASASCVTEWRDSLRASAATRTPAGQSILAERSARATIEAGLSSSDILPSQWTPPPRSGVRFKGFDCTIDGMQAWSVASQDNDEIAFEVRSGDRLYNPETRYQDPPQAERAELAINSMRWRQDTVVSVRYEFLVPAGFDFASPWTVTGQMHADLNLPPPVELGFRAGIGVNRFVVTTRQGRRGAITEQEHPLGRQPLARDVWHSVRLDTKMGSDGYLNVWLDQMTSLQIHGPVGFSDQTIWYWRMGLYRRAVQETYRVRIRRFEMLQL